MTGRVSQAIFIDPGKRPKSWTPTSSLEAMEAVEALEAMEGPNR